MVSPQVTIADRQFTYSIIVPVFEQWHLISNFIAALHSQTLDTTQYEVILVDNGSAFLEEPDCRGLNVEILKCERPGSYAARNVGAKSARGEWLIFTDSDCLPRPNWLAVIDRYLVDFGHSDLLLAGEVNVSPPSQANWFQIYDSVKGINQSLYVNSGCAATANLIVNKDAFRRFGKFSEIAYSGGDFEFCGRAVRQGAKIAYLPDAIVDHPARSSWSEVKTKAIRVLGGRLSRVKSGKWLAVLRTLAPPIRAIGRFVGKKDAPLTHRLIAIVIQLRLWLSEVGEALSIVAGKVPERR